MEIQSRELLSSDFEHRFRPEKLHPLCGRRGGILRVYCRKIEEAADAFSPKDAILTGT